MLTLSEASKETGLTRSGIFKAIKGGKISATKDANGHFQIDPAELFRVYKPVNREVVKSEQQETHQELRETAENKELRVRVEVMGQVLRQVESERDDLRRRLDEEAAERRNLTALLTHKPEAPRKPAAPPPAEMGRSAGEWAGIGIVSSFLLLVAGLTVAHWLGFV